MIVFFSFLTFYSAYFDKVKDCGCFGDALKLTPWGSFTKDIVLLFFILILFFGMNHIKPIFNKLNITILALLSFILSFWLYYERIMYAEETFLIKKFGDEYTNWSKDVPPFIPKFSNYLKPSLDFAWRKIIRQEKSGIAALFIVFMLFHQVAFYFTNGEPDLSMSLWNVLFIVFTIYIAVIKAIQKSTDWLDIEKTR